MASMDSALERRITIVGREGAGAADGAAAEVAATAGVGAETVATFAAVTGVIVGGVLSPRVLVGPVQWQPVQM